MRVPPSFSFFLGATLALSSTVASAQERDPAAAKALFDQAQALIQQEHFAEACPKLQESNRLDPGIGTQFHLANCYERSGRIASAWAAFSEVAAHTRAKGEVERAKVAQQRAEALESRLPRLTVIVPEASKVSGLEIRRNGILVGAAQWGTPVPVDPGEVELTATAPGKQALRQTLRLEEGKTSNYSLPTLDLDESAAAPAASATTAPQAAAPSATSPVAPASLPHDQPAAKSSNAPWIIALAGVGVVGAGLGTAFAVMAKSKYNESLSAGRCDTDNRNLCGSTGVELRNDARTKGDIATVSIIVGGAALAGAGIVWLASGSAEEKYAVSSTRLRAAPAIGPNLAALFVQGRF